MKRNQYSGRSKYRRSGWWKWYSGRSKYIISGKQIVVLIGEYKENGDVAMCAICREMFSSGESAKRLACTHLYHSKCILKWFDRNQSCPICRRQLVLIEGSLVVLDLNEQGWILASLSISLLFFLISFL